jgi:3-methyladenine DNA glycosylase AlkD
MDAAGRAAALVEELRSLGRPENVAGMARYGINPEGTLGVSMPQLRAMAKREGRDHALAEALWATGLHEPRILAALVDEPAEVTAEQMERWVRDFDSWDVCDQVCANLFDRTPFAYEKAAQWARREPTFERRAGFALMAALAWHDKRAADDRFLPFLPLIAEAADDERNFVKKAVNWALRQIGKRDVALNDDCVTLAEELSARESRAARWVGRDAVLELTSEKVRERLGG